MSFFSQPHPSRKSWLSSTSMSPPHRYLPSAGQIFVPGGGTRRAAASPSSSSSASSSASPQRRGSVGYNAALENKTMESEMTPPRSGDEHNASTLKLVFTLLDGECEQIKTLELKDGAAPLILGRRGSGQAANLVDGAIGCAVMSKKHAQVYNKNGRIYIEDIGSMHGTTVNALRLHGPTPHELRNGDRVNFGKDVSKQGKVNSAFRVSVSISKISPPQRDSTSTSPAAACELFARALPSSSSSSSRARSPLPHPRSESPTSPVLQSTSRASKSPFNDMPELVSSRPSERLASQSFSVSPPADIRRYGWTTEDEEADASAVDAVGSPVFSPAAHSVASEDEHEVPISEASVEAEPSSSPQAAAPRNASHSPELGSESFASNILEDSISWKGPGSFSPLRVPTLSGELGAFVKSRRGRTIPVPAEDEESHDDDDEAPEEMEIEFGGRRRDMNEGRWSHHEDEDANMEEGSANNDDVAPFIHPVTLADLGFDLSEQSSTSSSKRNPVLRRRAKLQKRRKSQEYANSPFKRPSSVVTSAIAQSNETAQSLHFNTLPKIASAARDGSDMDTSDSDAQESDAELKEQVASMTARLLLETELAESEDTDDDFESPREEESSLIDLAADEEDEDVMQEEEDDWEEEDEFDSAAHVTEDSDDGSCDVDVGGDDTTVEITIVEDSSDEEVKITESSKPAVVSEGEVDLTTVVDDSDDEDTGYDEDGVYWEKGVVVDERADVSARTKGAHEQKNIKPVPAAAVEPVPAAAVAPVSVELVSQIESFTHKVEALESHLEKTTNLIESTLGKRKRLDDEDDASPLASTSTQTLPIVTGVAESSHQTTAIAEEVKPSLAAADVPLPNPDQPIRKKSRIGSFLLGALTGSVATLGALAAYGWNEEAV